MKVAKKHLEIFYSALKDTNLKLSDARIRDSFLKPVGEALDQFNKDRNKVYETFCQKKEDGTPDIQDNKYTFPKEVIDQVNTELTTLMNEEVELTPHEKIKEFLHGTNYSPKVGEVEAIDEIISKL